MAAVMHATYPELFASGALIAGLAFGGANTAFEALDRMRGSRASSDADLLGLVRSASSHGGPWPSITIWQGAADHTVAPANADHISARGGKRRSHPGSGVLKGSWILIPKVMGRFESRIAGGTALATTLRDGRYGDFLMRRLPWRLGAFLTGSMPLVLTALDPSEPARSKLQWRTRHDSNVRPLPSEGNALSS